MKLIDAANSLLRPVIPDSLRPYIDIHYTCSLNESECIAFSKALLGLQSMLQTHPHLDHIPWAHVVFVGSPRLSLELEDDASGYFSPFIVYPVYLWRSCNYSVDQIMLAMVEELCHCFWTIRDEKTVKLLDIEFMRHLGLSLSWPQ